MKERIKLTLTDSRIKVLSEKIKQLQSNARVEQDFYELGLALLELGDLVRLLKSEDYGKVYYYREALKIFDQLPLGLVAKNIGVAHQKIADVYKALGQHKDAIKEFSAAVKHFSPEHDKEKIIYCRSSMATCYQDLAKKTSKFKKQLRYLDCAQQELKEVLAPTLARDDKKVISHLLQILDSKIFLLLKQDKDNFFAVKCLCGQVVKFAKKLSSSPYESLRVGLWVNLCLAKGDEKYFRWAQYFINQFRKQDVMLGMRMPIATEQGNFEECYAKCLRRLKIDTKNSELEMMAGFLKVLLGYQKTGMYIGEEVKETSSSVEKKVVVCDDYIEAGLHFSRVENPRKFSFMAVEKFYFYQAVGLYWYVVTSGKNSRELLYRAAIYLKNVLKYLGGGKENPLQNPARQLFKNTILNYIACHFDEKLRVDIKDGVAEAMKDNQLLSQQKLASVEGFFHIADMVVEKLGDKKPDSDTVYKESIDCTVECITENRQWLTVTMGKMDFSLQAYRDIQKIGGGANAEVHLIEYAGKLYAMKAFNMAHLNSNDDLEELLVGGIFNSCGNIVNYYGIILGKCANTTKQCPRLQILECSSKELDGLVGKCLEELSVEVKFKKHSFEKDNHETVEVAYNKMFLVKNKSTGQWYFIGKTASGKVIKAAVEELDCFDLELKTLGRSIKEFLKKTHLFNTVLARKFEIELLLLKSAQLNYNPAIHLVMECLDKTLTNHVTTNEFLVTSLVERLALMQQFLNGLRFMHDRELVNRDIKSDNTMLSVEGEVKIVDLGSVKRVNSEKIAREYICSTRGYIAPEIAQEFGGRSVYSFGSDVFAASVMFVIEMLFAQLLYNPFDEYYLHHKGKSTRSRIGNLDGVFTGLGFREIFVPLLPKEAVIAFEKCMAHDRNIRLTVGELYDAIEIAKIRLRNLQTEVLAILRPEIEDEQERDESQIIGALRDRLQGETVVSIRGLNNDEMTLLLRAIREVPSVITIDLAGNVFAESAAVEVRNILRSGAHDIQALILDGVKLGNHFNYVFDGFKENKTLRVLSLRDCDIAGNILKQLCAVLASDEKRIWFGRIYLRGNTDITDDDLTRITELYKERGILAKLLLFAVSNEYEFSAPKARGLQNQYFENLKSYLGLYKGNLETLLMMVLQCRARVGLVDEQMPLFTAISYDWGPTIAFIINEISKDELLGHTVGMYIKNNEASNVLGEINVL